MHLEDTWSGCVSQPRAGQPRSLSPLGAAQDSHSHVFRLTQSSLLQDCRNHSWSTKHVHGDGDKRR